VLAVRIQAVEQGEVALARDAERELDPVQGELVGEQLPAASKSWIQDERGVRGAWIGLQAVVGA
jgi:hypothetical protein